MTDVYQSRYGFVVMILITLLATQPVSVNCLDNGVACRLACSIWRVFHDTFVKSNNSDIVYDNCMRTCQQYRAEQEETTTRQPSTTTTTPSVPRKSCGLQLRDSARIVGGTIADKCEFPWVVALYVDDMGFICGGSVVDSRHVITAAHCVLDEYTGATLSPSLVTVGYGFSVREYQDIVNVTRVLPHPLYSETNFDNDVAVLTLAEDLVYDKCVSPICLPDVDSDPNKADKCTAAGWGTTSYYGDDKPSILRKVDLAIVDQKICSSNDSYGNKSINELKLCAGNFEEGGIGTCYGDSGGPLMCTTDGSFYIHGVNSFGRGCAFRRYPDVFTRVAHPSIMKFITEGINDIPRDS